MKFGGYDPQAQLAASTEARDRDEQREIEWNENCECVLSPKRSQKTKRVVRASGGHQLWI